MSDMRDKARFKESIETLVEGFTASHGVSADIGAGNGNRREHQTRSDVIDGMLTGLGWTLTQQERDMWEEVRVKGERTLYLDYLGKDPRSQTPLLIVEAKAEGKPVVSLSSSSIADLGADTQSVDDATVVARAVDHLKEGGDVASSPVTREWAEWIEKLRDYVSSVHKYSGHRVKRVAITSGRWLVIFCNPVLAFLEPGRAADSGILCFREDDFVQQSDKIYDWLARSVLVCEPPERLRPAQLRAYVAGDHIAGTFRALWVVHGKVGAHFDERPQITVYPALLLQRYDGLLITVMDDRAGGFMNNGPQLTRLLAGPGQSFLSGFGIMGDFGLPPFTRPYAPWTRSSCVGLNGNTRNSEPTRCGPGIGCGASKRGDRPCSRIGDSGVRLDDGSCMSREAHVQFWEGLAVRFRWATRLSQGLHIHTRSASFSC